MRHVVAVKENFSVDVAIFLLFLIGFEPALTGNAVHEWLNLVFAGTMLLHLLMHWDWLADVVTRRKLQRVSRIKHLNFYLDLFLFIVFVMMILSGLMISRSVLASSGSIAPRHTVWRELHSGFGNVLLLLVGLHFALHWKWIVYACTRYRIMPLKGQLRPPSISI
jgi:hypothetical protein